MEKEICRDVQFFHRALQLAAVYVADGKTVTKFLTGVEIHTGTAVSKVSAVSTGGSSNVRSF